MANDYRIESKDPRVDVLVACLKRLRDTFGSIQLNIGFGEAVTLISLVQLALRHPANTGASAQEARTIIDRWIDALEASEPEIGPLLRLGFDPSHDVPRKEPPHAR